MQERMTILKCNKSYIELDLPSEYPIYIPPTYTVCSKNGVCDLRLCSPLFGDLSGRETSDSSCFMREVISTGTPRGGDSCQLDGQVSEQCLYTRPETLSS